MRTVALLLVAVATVGCGGRARHAREMSIEDLRELAEERPRDLSVQRELAAAELLAADGDPERAAPQIAKAKRLGARDVRVLFLHAVERDAHGEPSEALEAYLATVEAAAGSNDPLAPALSEVAASALDDLKDSVAGYSSEVQRSFEARLGDEIDPATRQTVADALVDLAYRRGDTAAARRLAVEHAHCIPAWQVIGPIGPRDLLGFDAPLDPALARGSFPESFDLGPSRGVRARRDVEARGCASHLGGGPVGGGGVTLARAPFRAETGGTHWLRLETPNAVELYVDGERRVRLDTRRETIARTTFHPLELSAGEHQIVVRVGTRHPNPILVVSIVPPARAGDWASELPRGRDALSTYLRAALSMARGDTIGAHEAVRTHVAARRGGSPVVLSLAAGIALGHPFLLPDIRRDEARGFLRRAAKRDAKAWVPRLQLARLEAADGRLLEAIGALERAQRQWPNVVAVPLSLAELYEARDWDAQADAAVATARRVVPDSCVPLRAEMLAARRRGRAARVGELADELVSCDSRSDARFSYLVRQRRWEDAGRELERLAALEPRQARFGVLNARLEVEHGRQDAEAIERTLAELRDLSPQNDGIPLQQADRLLGAGREDEARTLLAAAIAAEPAAMADLRRVRRAIGGDWPLDAHRLDGAAVIRDFEASGRRYDEPAVLVLDYTVVRVFEDGSTLELTHNIWRIQSEEAVDEQGEFHPPEGAQMLQLHTVKPDGRRLEPDEIEGKETISLPLLAVGDYVEYEYVRIGSPPQGFPGGYLGDRFYFRSFEIPYDRSELTVVMPEAMEPLIDPRGPAPETEQRVENGVRVLHWKVLESRPLVPEPGSVAPREFIPSINLGWRTSWELFVEGIRDILADRDVRDPAAERLVARLAPRELPPEQRARRLYFWVLENVEESGESYGLAPAMLAAKNGNRARVLHYMLGLSGISSELVVARSVGSDSTRSSLPDGETYENLIVRVRLGDRRVFLSTYDRGAPFAYLPPMLRGQDALIIAEGAPRVTLPAHREGEDRRTIEATVTVDRDGSARVEVVETYRGAGAVGWRNDLEGIPAAQLEGRFEEQYAARLIPDARLESLEIVGRDEPDEPLTLRYVVEVEILGRRVGSRWALPGLFPTLVTPNFARLATRTTPQLIAAGLDLEIIIRLDTPGDEPAAAPSTVDLRGPNDSHFTMRARPDDDTLVLTRRLELPQQRITPADYPAFTTFARAIDQAEAREIPVTLR